ncbi:hypothetical protein OUZ56_009472 [Daphnia magna]|uniref:Uncharacterized protein n=1 Tax=Daphnia magna TaxID=35525 RepID=A0ABR0AG36_9CRUS|nr:hypothetical protein OUZ56_009472 [Daphnia magna]
MHSLTHPPILNPVIQLGLRKTVSKGLARNRYIPEGLFRPFDWLSPLLHPSMSFCFPLPHFPDVQYPAHKSEHRLNFLKPPIGGKEGRRSNGHIGHPHSGHPDILGMS